MLPAADRAVTVSTHLLVLVCSVCVQVTTSRLCRLTACLSTTCPGPNTTRPSCQSPPLLMTAVSGRQGCTHACCFPCLPVSTAASCASTLVSTRTTWGNTHMPALCCCLNPLFQMGRSHNHPTPRGGTYALSNLITHYTCRRDVLLSADIMPGQGLYYTTLTKSWRVKNCTVSCSFKSNCGFGWKCLNHVSAACIWP